MLILIIVLVLLLGGGGGQPRIGNEQLTGTKGAISWHGANVSYEDVGAIPDVCQNHLLGSSRR